MLILQNAFSLRKSQSLIFKMEVSYDRKLCDKEKDKYSRKRKKNIFFLFRQKLNSFKIRNFSPTKSMSLAFKETK